MIRKQPGALLCVAVLCSTVAAHKESEYRAGRLLSISDQSYAWPPGGPVQPAYLLQIQDGANKYLALSPEALSFGHDDDSQLKPESNIQYRISGKSLFLKTLDNREIKARLCEMALA